MNGILSEHVDYKKTFYHIRVKKKSKGILRISKSQRKRLLELITGQINLKAGFTQ